MTAAVFRNTPALSVPQSQNTAPVLEFNCLYTHDIRKKNKKWQDGSLRYHTFNKRIMVYDVPRNLIGDTHWTSDEAVQEGDEVTLDRNGVLVEVGDSIGQTETDLTELRKSRKKDQPGSKASTPARTIPNGSARLGNAAGSVSRGITQQKHRSLNALLGTPKGPIGKATLPTKSPFEERHADIENEEWEEGRPPKRARVGSAPAWNVTRTTTTPKSAKQTQQPPWARTADAAKQKKKAPLQPGQQRLGTREIIDLADEEDPKGDFLPGFSDSALEPCSSPKQKTSNAAPKQKASVRSSSPAFQTQRVPAKPVNDKHVIDVDGLSRQRDFQRAKTATNGTLEHGKDGASEKEKRRLECDSPGTMRESSSLSRAPSPRPSRPASSRPGQMLRLAASGPKKKTLLCQDQLKKKPKRISSTNTDELAQGLIDEFHEDENENGGRPKTARERFEERLARIDKKRGSTSNARLQSLKVAPPPVEIDSDDGEEAPTDNTIQERPRTSHEASAIDPRRLDDMMLPPAPLSARREESPAPAPPVPRPSASIQQEARPFRRAISDSITTSSGKPRRVPGAPVRYTPTPSPTRRSREPTPSAGPGSRPTSKAGPPPPRTNNRNGSIKQKRPLQKSVSLYVSAHGMSTVLLSKPFQAPGKSKAQKQTEPEQPKEVEGPWSREAFDLFTWRPPNWDEENWCQKAGEEKEHGVARAQDMDNQEEGAPPVGLSGGVSFPHA
ncbi:Hypothetical predicted protein [Lecanosticta acicola]|uniref:5'-3' DNA helicase ZGRF1-like N-terminal domain-containing protein n=1 Tax=Lecanosticta acicola TaxID=111012 RepID=A0AAI8YUC2_9PEZI|nr:Hypothetical predicted protein [Lecanosticta acicola]